MKNEDIEKVYKENFMIVYKFLNSMTRNKYIAEDLTQETFYKAIINIKKFRGNCKMSVWLCEIAKNLYLNQLKKDKKIVFTNIDTTEICNQYSITDEIQRKQEIQKLHKKISTLDETLQKIFYLRMYGDMTFKEIGKIIGRGEIWVRTNFYRAKQKIKEEKEENDNV